MASSTGSCGLKHPEYTELVCDRRGPHPVHSGLDADDEYQDWPNEHYVAPLRTHRSAVSSALAAVAARVPAAPPQPVREGFQAGLKASAESAANWTDAQKKLVDDAIIAVATGHRGGGEFTSDAVWDHLGARVPVTKGLTSRLTVARRRGLIESTGKTEISDRGGHHDHGQRLTIWYSLLPSS